MASRRLLSPLLRSPSRFSISNHNPTLSTPSQSPYAHLLRNVLLTGRRMLHTSSSITAGIKLHIDCEEDEFGNAKLKVTWQQAGEESTMHVPRKRAQDYDHDDSLTEIDPELRYSFHCNYQLHVKRRMNKEERLALVKAGREERGKYMARAAVKQNKEGGSSNKQKQQKYATCCKKGKGS